MTTGRDGRRRLVGHVLVAASLLGCCMSGAGLRAQTAREVREESVRIDGPIPGMQLSLRHATAGSNADGSAKPIVLMLHGAVVPVSANLDYHIGGRSLMTALAERGLDVWALDFYGFGESSRYPEMTMPADRHAPLGRAEECATQVDSAVAFLLRRARVKRIMLFANSGGSLVGGLYATRRPELISRLVLYGPVTPFTAGPLATATLPAHTVVVPSELWSVFASWAAVASGRFIYDPGQIRAPTLIVFGEFDAVTTLEGGQWLLHALRQAPERHMTVLGGGSHVVQYETRHTELYRVVGDFLRQSD